MSCSVDQSLIMLRLHNQETPSRILRRIKEAENDSDMPSLPSMASIDGSDEDDGSMDDTANAGAEPARAASADLAAANVSSTSAGRRGLRKLVKNHQNTTRSSSNDDNNSAPRNILSPLKLNGRSSPSTNSPSDAGQANLKGKGKASPYGNTKSSSPGPLSAVSSNRTVRPSSQSPHAFRAGSITPSVHVANRLNKPSRRTQAISFDDSLPQADHSSAHAQNDASEQQEVRYPLYRLFFEPQLTVCLQRS